MVLSPEIFRWCPHRLGTHYCQIVFFWRPEIYLFSWGLEAFFRIGAFTLWFPVPHCPLYWLIFLEITSKILHPNLTVRLHFASADRSLQSSATEYRFAALCGLFSLAFNCSAWRSFASPLRTIHLQALAKWVKSYAPDSPPHVSERVS